MAYLDAQKKIEETLTGRQAGTQVTPDSHQAMASEILDYIHDVENMQTGVVEGIATKDTAPVQPDACNVIYLSAVNSNNTVSYKNFADANGDAIQITADEDPLLVILFWNKKYWQFLAVKSAPHFHVATELGDTNDAVSQKTVTDALNEVKNVIDKIISDDEVKQQDLLFGKDYNGETLELKTATSAYMQIRYSDGKPYSKGGNSSYVSDYIDVSKINTLEYNLHAFYSECAAIAAYDKDKNYIQANSLSLGYGCFTGLWKKAEGTAYIRVSMNKAVSTLKIPDVNFEGLSTLQGNVSTLQGLNVDLNNVFKPYETIAYEDGSIKSQGGPQVGRSKDINVANVDKLYYLLYCSYADVALIAAYDKDGKYIQENSVKSVIGYQRGVWTRGKNTIFIRVSFSIHASKIYLTSHNLFISATEVEYSDSTVAKIVTVKDKIDTLDKNVDDINAVNIVTEVNGWGDSLMESAGYSIDKPSSDNTSEIIGKLLQLINNGNGDDKKFIGTNFGVGGETSYQVATRQGALSLIAEPFTINADTAPSYLNIRGEMGDNTGYNNDDKFTDDVVCKLPNMNGKGINPVTINGIEGTITNHVKRSIVFGAATAASNIVIAIGFSDKNLTTNYQHTIAVTDGESADDIAKAVSAIKVDNWTIEVDGDDSTKVNFTYALTDSNNGVQVDSVGDSGVTTEITTATTYSFARTTAGDAVTLAYPTNIITNAQKNNRKCVAVIWFGQNDWINVSGSYKQQGDFSEYAKLIAKNVNDKYIFISHFCDNHASQGKKPDTYFVNKFGAHYINVAKWIARYGYAYAKSLGATFELTDNDKASISKLTIPQCFKIDAIHLNYWGYQCVVRAVYEAGKGLGYW